MAIDSRSSKSRSSRLLTRNLIISGTEAFDPGRTGNLKVSNFVDLCTLINTCALFDEISTLGHPRQKTPSKPYLYKRFRTLEDTFCVAVDIGPREPRELVSVVDLATPEDLPTTIADPLKQHVRRALESEIAEWPDYPKDLDEGKKLANMGETGGQDYRADFFYRSFAYVGYSRVLGVPLVPDAVRQAGMSSIQRPVDLAEQVLSAQQEANKDKVRLLIGRDLEVPPFAALAFREAQSDMSKLPDAVRNLRNRMTPVRKYLRSVADAKDFGVYQSRLQTLMPQRMTPSQLEALDRETKDLLHDISKDAVGLPSIVLKWRPVLSVVKGAFELIDALAAPQRKMVDLIRQGLKFVVDGTDPEFLSLFKDKPLAEIHRVAWDLNVWNGRGVNLTQLFGRIDDDRL
jgi:hypothetical protein